MFSSHENTLRASRPRRAASRGLRMNNILPGWIDTYPVAMEDIRQIPLARPGTPDDVAKAVAFLLSEDAAYIAGQDLLVDGGLVRAM